MLARFLFPLVVISSVVGLGAAACTVDVDKYQSQQGALSQDAGAFTFLDVRFKATEMVSHIGEYFEMRIVDKDDQVVAKLAYKGVTNQDFTLFFKSVVPKVNPPYRIDYWADHNTNHDGRYGGIVGGINEKDHAWRRILQDPLPADIVFTPPRYDFKFVHDTNFVDIATSLSGTKSSIDFNGATLNPFNLSVTGGAKYLGKMIESRVVEKATGRMVGFYRLGALADTQTFTVTDILDEQTTYVVSTYVDMNGDEKFNTDEPAYKVEMISDSKGISGTLDLGGESQATIDNGDSDLAPL